MRSSSWLAGLFAVVALSAGSAFAATPFSFINPSGGEVYIPGESYTIKLQASGSVKTIALEASTDNGATFSPLGLIDNTGKDKTKHNIFFWTIPANLSANAILRATGQSGKTPVSTLSGFFTIGNGSTISSVVIGAGALGPNSVTNPTIAPGAVDSSKITSSAASSGFLLSADGSGGALWSPINLLIPTGTITTAMLAPGATATNFSGPLLGDVTGTQGATVVSKVNFGTATLTGTVPLVNGGTAADLSATGGAGQYLKQSAVGAAITVGTIAAADLPSGSANYIQNQVAATQAAGLRISGNGLFEGGSLTVRSTAAVSTFAVEARPLNTVAGNTFVGVNAGAANTTGTQNTFSGMSAGLNNTTGNQNTFIGLAAGQNNTSGGNNTFSGYNAGLSNTVENNNTFIGQSSNGAVGITNATALGNAATVTQSDTVKLGNAAALALSGMALPPVSPAGEVKMYFDSTSKKLQISEDGAAYVNVLTNPGSFIQNQVAAAQAAGFRINGNGLFEGGSLTVRSTPLVSTFAAEARPLNTAANNTFVGVSAGPANTTGTANTFTGAGAGMSNTTGNNNTFSGVDAGMINTTGGNNTFIGVNAGRFNTTGNQNTFNGYDTGLNNTTGGNNTFTGTQAGFSNTTGSNNTFSGQAAGGSNTTGNSNTFNGEQTGNFNTTGSGNTFNGAGAGFSNSGGNNNTFSGVTAGLSNSGSNNTFSGANAGQNNSTGSNNTFSGMNAGLSNGVESNNTFIGQASNGAVGITNATALGAGASVTTSNTVVLGNACATKLTGPLNVPTGANAIAGTVTLAASSATVGTTSVTATSVIIVSYKTLSGGNGFLSIGTVTAGTSFVINSTGAADTSVVSWWIVN